MTIAIIFKNTKIALIEWMKLKTRRKTKTGNCIFSCGVAAKKNKIATNLALLTLSQN